MKQGWEIKKLGEICHTSNGLWKGKRPPFITIGVLRSTNFTKDCRLKLDDVAYIEVEEKSFAKRQLQRNDIVVERSGGGPNQPVGRVLLFDIDDGNFSFCNFTSALRVIDSAYISPIYLHKYLSYFYLSGRTVKMQSNTIGLRNLDYTKYLDVDVPIPSLAEQNRIVEILDREFERIDALKANAEQNLQHAKDLFQSALKQELQPKEGWHKYQLADVCDYRKEQGQYPNLPYVGMENIESGSGMLLGVQRGEDMLSTTFRFRKDYVMYGRLRPYLKKVFVADFDGCCSTEIFPIVVDGVLPHLLKYWFLSDFITDKINATCGGCRMPRANMNDVKKFDIWLPSIGEQEEIVSRLEELNERCKALEENYIKTIALCDDMKQALLRKAFNGEL